MPNKERNNQLTDEQKSRIEKGGFVCDFCEHSLYGKSREKNNKISYRFYECLISGVTQPLVDCSQKKIVDKDG